MKKLKTYIDTSVFGALYDIEDKYRVEITQQFSMIMKQKDKFIPCISNVVIEEIEKAPLTIKRDLKNKIKNIEPTIIYENEECTILVEEYLKRKIIPRKYRDNARHIAVAVVHNLDIIITWNCRHMANIEKKRQINGVNISLGYNQIDIVTPMEVIGYG
ncbi:MAG: hypothetical protein DRN20_01480 [Thermoplasmata archaeon]|nr:MAG: hypothetical protein DRN20_01480 [Thermoplasmata archaeon]